MASEKQQITNPDSNLSEQAMTRVLRAEEAANNAIKACEEEGIQTLQKARERAQKISKHADKRISYIHLRFKQCIAAQVKILKREYAAQHQQIHAEHYGDTDLDDIVDSVAHLLTGGADPGPERQD